MWYDAYAEAAERHCNEIASELRQMDLAALYWECRELGQSAFFDYLFQNQTRLLDHVAATPSERRRRAAKLSPTERRRLYLGALYYASFGRLFLEGLSDQALGPGPSYRALHRGAACAAMPLLAQAPAWPFPDDYPDPFEDP